MSGLAKAYVEIALLLGFALTVGPVMLSTELWLTPITDAMEAALPWYGQPLFFLGVLAALLVVGSVSDNETVEGAVFIGIVGMLFAGALTFSFAATDYLTPIIQAQAPGWSPLVWVGIALAAGVCLIASSIGVSVWVSRGESA